MSKEDEIVKLVVLSLPGLRGIKSNNYVSDIYTKFNVFGVCISKERIPLFGM